MKIKDCIIQESKPDQTGQQDRTNPCLGQGCVLLLQREGGTFWKGLSAGRNDTHRDSFRWVLVPLVPMVTGGGCGPQGKVTLAS